jgi:hypothetical protein
VEVVIGPWNDDDATVAADPQTHIGSASSVFKPDGFPAWDVCLGAGHSANIHFMGESGPSSVFSMRTISGFFRYTSEHRASVLDISQGKMERISPARYYRFI